MASEAPAVKLPKEVDEILLIAQKVEDVVDENNFEVVFSAIINTLYFMEGSRLLWSSKNLNTETENN